MIDTVDRGLIMMQLDREHTNALKMFSFTGAYAIIVRMLVNMV
jgi:hypothetical protein